ncbi:MAG: SH3 domain-containing protein [Oscillospiraceae bacterium]
MKKKNTEPAGAVPENAPACAPSAPAISPAAEVAPVLQAEQPAPLPAVCGERVAAVQSPFDLNMRAGPDKNFDVLAVLPDGAPVTVLSLPYGVEVPGWALLLSADGKPGWVMAEFLSTPARV